MSKHKTILSSFLGKAYKMSADEISELIEKSDDELNESDVLKALLDKDTERVGSLRTRLFAEGAKKAEANAKKNFYGTLRSAFELDDETSEDDVIDAIKTKLQAAKPSGKELTDEDVKKHPLYLKTESAFNKKLKELADDYEGKVSAVKHEFTKKEVGSRVAKKASDVFTGLNPILSPDQTKANNQVGNFVNRFATLDWEEADGEFYLMDGGKRKEDEHGHAIALSTLVKAEAETIFDFKKAEARKGAGDYHQPGDEKKKENGAEKYTGKLPGNLAEYNSMMNDRTIPLADRKQIHSHWETKTANAGNN